MSAYTSDFLHTLQSRGFISQVSNPDDLDALFRTERVTAYTGFDCTASSFHVGSLVQIMLLHWLQATGHRPIVLMGGGTTRVGDPSDKDEMRRMLSAEQIEENKAGLKRAFEPFIEFGDDAALMVDNADWLLDINYVEFLRDVGRHFSINRLLTFEGVKRRLEREQPLSFLEFNYMILQAYDFTELHRRYGCRLQFGGSEQWGNIISGIDLGRRLDGADLFALTTPLITTASGAKMGKTAAGAVWLNSDLLSPYEYWQFWRNTEDADVGRFLRLFTTLALDEIARLESLDGAELNDAKKTLATEATALLHGRACADDAADTARRTFEQGEVGSALPTVEVTSAELSDGIGILSAFVRAGLAASNGEARRHIKGGALKINDTQVADERAMLTGADAGEDGTIKLSVGRKRHALLKVS